MDKLTSARVIGVLSLLFIGGVLFLCAVPTYWAWFRLLTFVRVMERRWYSQFRMKWPFARVIRAYIWFNRVLGLAVVMLWLVAFVAVAIGVLRL